MSSKGSTKQPISKRIIWRSLAATIGLCFLMLFTIIAGNVQDASAHSMTSRQASGKGKFVYYALSKNRVSQPLKITTIKIAPRSYISCLGVAMTADNYAVTDVRVTLGIGNYCANDLVDVNWEYSSTVICLGQSRGGPGDSGTYGRLPKGSFATVANKDWYEACIDGNNLQPTYYQTSYTGTGSGPIAGSSNIGEGSDTTPEETFR